MIKIKTITICGSMKFSQEMKEISLKLESIKGFNVIQCIYNENREILTDKMIINLESAHYKKIDLCDAIYVVDINNYIGLSVKREILYAKEKGKEIIFHSKQSDDSFYC